MNSDQEKLLKIRVDKIPEIRISMDAIVDFITIYSQEENINFKKVIGYFQMLTDQDRKILLENVVINNGDNNLIH